MNPSKIKNYEITLEIETGNLLHRKFTNKEDLLKFLSEYANNPKKILKEITPKVRKESRKPSARK
ncbi:hypothetical protein DIM_08520 [Candidatus Denitrolinea symbiosum]|jgi:hypothetical protein|nr:hypothetical protein DIM_08520 [Candidatus Denitrolinea symbiosum]